MQRFVKCASSFICNFLCQDVVERCLVVEEDHDVIKGDMGNKTPTLCHWIFTWDEACGIKEGCMPTIS